MNHQRLSDCGACQLIFDYHLSSRFIRFVLNRSAPCLCVCWSTGSIHCFCCYFYRKHLIFFCGVFLNFKVLARQLDLRFEWNLRRPTDRTRRNLNTWGSHYGHDQGTKKPGASVLYHRSYPAPQRQMQSHCRRLTACTVGRTCGIYSRPTVVFLHKSRTTKEPPCLVSCWLMKSQ